MRQPVAHTGELRPWKGWFAGEQLRRDGFDRFADLDEPDPRGVEDQPVIQVAALEMGADGVDRGHDVLERIARHLSTHRLEVRDDPDALIFVGPKGGVLRRRFGERILRPAAREQDSTD
jgi:hypothetical protein